jgi:hypothetical protein
MFSTCASVGVLLNSGGSWQWFKAGGTHCWKNYLKLVMLNSVMVCVFRMACDDYRVATLMYNV